MQERYQQQAESKVADFLSTLWVPPRGINHPAKCPFPRLTATYLPPNSCMPSRAKTTMKRKRRKSRLIIDFMELIRETTKFLKDAQYLEKRCGWSTCSSVSRRAATGSGLQGWRVTGTGGWHLLGYFKYS